MPSVLVPAMVPLLVRVAMLPELYMPLVLPRMRPLFVRVAILPLDSTAVWPPRMTPPTALARVPMEPVSSLSMPLTLVPEMVPLLVRVVMPP